MPSVWPEYAVLEKWQAEDLSVNSVRLSRQCHCHWPVSLPGSDVKYKEPDQDRPEVQTDRGPICAASLCTLCYQLRGPSASLVSASPYWPKNVDVLLVKAAVLYNRDQVGKHDNKSKRGCLPRTHAQTTGCRRSPISLPRPKNPLNPPPFGLFPAFFPFPPPFLPSFSKQPHDRIPAHSRYLIIHLSLLACTATFIPPTGVSDGASHTLHLKRTSGIHGLHATRRPPLTDHRPPELEAKKESNDNGCYTYTYTNSGPATTSRQ